MTGRDEGIVGSSTRQKRWDERTAGADAYAGDLKLPGLLTARVLRSPFPHAKIVDLDVAAAQRMPGVRAVITASDFPETTRYLHSGPQHADRSPLARDVVRYVGEEIAAVAAVTAAQAEAATGAFKVRYRRLRAPLTVDAAVTKGARGLHRRAGPEPNVSVHSAGAWGDPERAQQSSAIKVRGVYSYPRVSHACMEPNTTLAWWHPETGRLELWTSTQSPWFVITELAHVLDLDPTQIICRDVAVGGSFGSKSKVGEHEALAARLSMATGQPVRLEYSREEEFAATKPRHAFRADLTTFANNDGRLKALDIRLDVDNGAYNHFGPSVMAIGIHSLGSIYQPDGISWDARLIDTALPPGGQFRGYGVPQVAFALESHVDEIAQQVGMDPLKLRLRNATEPGSITLNGSRIGSANLAECLTRVRDAIDWNTKRASGIPNRGVGVACGIHGSGYFTRPGANRSDAAVDLFADGHARVRFGGADAGTGQRTILAQIAAEELGLDVDSVEVIMADSDLTPFDMGAWSSRGTHMSGHAVMRAAKELADEIREVARAKLGDENITLARGMASSIADDVLIGDLVGLSHNANDGVLTAEISYVDPIMEPVYGDKQNPNLSATYTVAAHAVEVEVDPATGRVHVLDYVAAHDIGAAINPTAVRGQIIGGVVQGIGAALGEELIYEGGTMVNPSYLNYALPRSGDLPAIKTILVSSDEHAGPYGAKSVGELPIIPPAPAIANAVYDAIGIRIREAPITPDKILAALAERDGRRRRYHLWRRPSRWWIALLRSCYPYGVHFILDRLGTRFARRPGPSSPERVVAPSTMNDLLNTHEPDSILLAGGTDVMPAYRQGLVTARTLVRIDNVPGLVGIDYTTGGDLRIGAATTLDELARVAGERLPALAAAIATIASAQVRAVATVGGNLLQGKRCWFFRNGFNCYKRGGTTCPCYAIMGDHRFYHAVIDGHRCQAVTPSDLATVFTALDAVVELRLGDARRTMPVEELYSGPGEARLRPGEVLTAVIVQRGALGRRCVFDKLQLWNGDFALLAVAVSGWVTQGRVEDPRIVLGSMAPTPWRARRTEHAMDGKPFDAERLEKLLDAEFNHHAHPLPGNAWKLDAGLGLAVRASQRLVRAAVEDA